MFQVSPFICWFSNWLEGQVKGKWKYLSSFSRQQESRSTAETDRFQAINWIANGKSGLQNGKHKNRDLITTMMVTRIWRRLVQHTLNTMSWWDTVKHGWRKKPGKRTFYQRVEKWGNMGEKCRPSRIISELTESST